jgi:uridine kinase
MSDKGKPYIIGIAGGSSSGKTSFLNQLVSLMPEDSVSVISQDNYYFPKEQQQKDKNGQHNFDLPTSIDRVSFYTDIKKLLNGEHIRRKEYTFNNPDKVPKDIVTLSSPVILVEGLFVFYYEEVLESLDLRVFIEADEDVKLARRLKRDYEERGYPEDHVNYQWENHVVPAYENYLFPFRHLADIIIMNNYSYQESLKIIAFYLQSKVDLSVRI